MHSNLSSEALRRQRTPVVLGNWKMHGNRASIDVLAAALAAGTRSAAWCQAVELAVFPPYPYLESVARHLSGCPIGWGAQHVSAFGDGAYTGEVSAEMLSDWACRWVLVGHSERRQYWGEDDAHVAQLTKRVLAAGLQPVICVGESAAERLEGRTEAVLSRQLDAMVPALLSGGARCLVAYEPIWAIGTGVSATADQAQAVHQFVRAHLRQTLGDGVETLRILYGGSVKAANAGVLLAQPDIDGALVGGASLIADEFLAIARAAAPNF
jgi:triosephosphate isomerase